MIISMDNSNIESGGVGVLEQSPSSDTPPKVDTQTFPNSLDTAPPVPESADSAGIVDKLHEFDTKRVGDDRKVRHARAKYINELVKTQSESVLREAASHFMTVGDDGKIKESSSVKSLRDRLVKEKGAELTKTGMDQAAVVQGQTALYKDILTTAAQDLPEEQKSHYLSKRLTANVAAKRRTLEGRNPKKKSSVDVSPSVQTPVQEMPLSRRMQQESLDTNVAQAQAALDRAQDPLASSQTESYQAAIGVKAAEAALDAAKAQAAFARGRQNNINQENVAQAQAALDRARNPLPSDQTDAYFAAIGEHAVKEQAQQDKSDRMFAEGRQRDAQRIADEAAALDAARRQAEAAHTQGLANAADAAEASRKDNPNYVKPGDPDDTAGQARVREYRVQENQALQEAQRQADEAAAKTRADAQLAEQRAKLDAIKVETSKGYTEEPERKFTNEALKDLLHDTKAQSDMARIRALHRDGRIPEDRKAALQAEYDAGKAAYEASFPQGSSNRMTLEEFANSPEGKAMGARFKAMDAEMSRLEATKVKDERSARDRLAGFARRLRPNRTGMFVAGFVAGSLVTGAGYEATHSSHVASSDSSSGYTEVLPSSQMPSEQNLADNGIRIGSDEEATSGQVDVGGGRLQAELGASDLNDGADTSAVMSGTEGTGGVAPQAEAPKGVGDGVSGALEGVGKATSPLKGGDMVTGGNATGSVGNSEGPAVETQSGDATIATETVTIPDGGSWGEELSGIDGSTEQGSQQINEFLNNEDNLDLIESTVLENPGGMTYAEIKTLFDAIRKGERPQSDGWHLLDNVAANTPVQKPTEAGVQVMHENRDGVYTTLIGTNSSEPALGGNATGTISDNANAETANSSTDQRNTTPAVDSGTSGGTQVGASPRGLGARIRGLFGGGN
jgi:hypothetical protein